MNLLSAYFSYAKDPKQTVRDIAARRSFGAAMLGYLTAALSYLVFLNVTAGLGAWSFIAQAGVLLLLELTAGYFIASLSGLFLDFSNHKGSGTELFIIIGLSGFIKSLLVVFALIAAVVPWISSVGIIVVLLVWVCQFVFIVRNLKRLYDISTGRAVGVLLFAAVPVAALALLLGALSVWAVLALF